MKGQQNMAMNIRKIIRLKYGWRFSRGEHSEAEQPGFDDQAWSEVSVPHDWAITGPFDRKNDQRHTRIVWDGEEKAIEHNGTTGGLPHIGIGWYRYVFTMSSKYSGKRIWLEFDGIMSNSSVFVNGHKAGGRPYGYSSFKLDITGLLISGADNLIAVRVENPPLSSRWYPGAGIYRNVRMLILEPVHVAHWGTYITTPEIIGNTASVSISTELENDSGAVVDTELRHRIVAPDGSEIPVVMRRLSLAAGKEQVTDTVRLENIRCWDVDAPELYTLISDVYVGGELRDHYETVFGIRELTFDPDRGFLLNGRNIKLNGVCLHHDLGPLGAAVNRRALERQLEIMRSMGCNAIRTSHNPPAPELPELCNQMGMLVIEEAFDEWRIAKMENGYHRFFDEWAELDLTDMIRRDRNHPSVIMWSIGNEIPEQKTTEGAATARFLHDICHRADPSRKTTAGFNYPYEAIENGLADAVDIPGWNYFPHEYRRFHREHPAWCCYGSETMSTVSSRGIYHFPLRDEKIFDSDNGHADLHLSSYDLAYPPWGTTMENEFHYQDESPFIMGQFVWTGFDYLGEPMPYNRQWPARSSYFGIVDLCGLPKDRYYAFMAKWTDRDVLHLLPCWTWPGREGQITPVHAYTNMERVELFLNGRKMGSRDRCRKHTNLLHHYRMTWDDVRYEPGELKAVGYRGGKAVCEKIVRTAGEPEQISVTADRTFIKADGDDMVFIVAEIKDENGVLCPNAALQLSFELDGPGEIVAVDNGDQTSLESFHSHSHNTFNGLCVGYIRSLPESPGKLTVKVSSPSLQGASIIIDVI